MTSVFNIVAIALIQLATPFSATPWANSLMQSGFFFIALHTHNDLKLYTTKSKLLGGHFELKFVPSFLPIFTGWQKIFIVYQTNIFNASLVTIVYQLWFFGQFPYSYRTIRTTRCDGPFSAQRINIGNRRLMTKSLRINRILRSRKTNQHQNDIYCHNNLQSFNVCHFVQWPHLYRSISTRRKHLMGIASKHNTGHRIAMSLKCVQRFQRSRTPNLYELI